MPTWRARLECLGGELEWHLPTTCIRLEHAREAAWESSPVKASRSLASGCTREANGLPMAHGHGRRRIGMDV